MSYFTLKILLRTYAMAVFKTDTFIYRCNPIHKHPKKMFKVEKLERLIELVLLTGYIKNDNAVSLMLIANPESFKTSILKSVTSNHSLEVMDLSPLIISKDIIPMIKDEKMQHLVIPDLVKIVSHKAHTVDSTIAFLNALMEEGVKRSMFFGQTFNLKRPIKCGLITSITPDYFLKVFKRWNDIGFVTRFLSISYKYSDETIGEIHKIIQESETLKLPVKKIKSIKKFDISIPKDISSFFAIKAQDIAKEELKSNIPTPVQGGKTQWVSTKTMGFRLQRQLRQLVRAIALSNNTKKPKVDWVEADELNTLLDYIRMFQNPKVI